MLKIEEDGDRWKGLIKPKIRLSGRWLERAGFNPGTRVSVVCLASGIIQLRCIPPTTVAEKEILSKSPGLPR
jgi:hypothetical protein